MKVIILEDDTEKLRRLVQVLLRGGVRSEGIFEARCTQQAKALLRTHRFDLLLLDINVPRRLEEMPISGEGTAFLEEISQRPKYNLPSSVIGVTAYTNEFHNAQPTFEAALIPMFLYERESSAWEAPLLKWIEYRIATLHGSTSEPSDYKSDFAIITALETPELKAVLDIEWNWSETTLENDDTTYFRGTTRRGKTVIAASSPFMGMPAASILCTKVIQQFRPRFLLHAGIAAGVRGQADIGDILVADPSWDWGSGKFVLEEQEVVFYSAPYQILLREDIRGKVRRLAADEAALVTIRSSWKGSKPNSMLSLKLGPIASGASVLADGQTKERIRDQHRKLLGIEMETYGVMAAAEFSTKPRPTAVSLKSVCDFADGQKNDEYQLYAAYTSARAVEYLVENLL